jgi:hypothetical protein
MHVESWVVVVLALLAFLTVVADGPGSHPGPPARRGGQ